MWIEAKPRNGRKETLFIFKFTSADDLNVFLKTLQLYATTSTDPGIRQYMTKFAADIQKRCDDKFADNRAKLSAAIFYDEMATFTDCLHRICFEFEMKKIQEFALSSSLEQRQKPTNDNEFLKKESEYLDKIRILTDALMTERNQYAQRKTYDDGIKNMIAHNQIAYITENGKQVPSYVVMSMEQYQRLTGIKE